MGVGWILSKKKFLSSSTSVRIFIENRLVSLNALDTFDRMIEYWFKDKVTYGKKFLDGSANSGKS